MVEHWADSARERALVHPRLVPALVRLKCFFHFRTYKSVAGQPQQQQQQSQFGSGLGGSAAGGAGGFGAAGGFGTVFFSGATLL